jgi:hypothetical protein
VSRGGKRQGQGRRAADGAKNVERVTLLLEHDDHEKLKVLGAEAGMSAWVRRAVRAAPLPTTQMHNESS